MDWSDGYVTDIGYTRGYYRELSSVLQAFVLAATGHEPPDLQAPFVKVELGCGYGVSLLMDAAVHPHATFYGVDFNPDHITWAKRIATAAGLDNVHFLETSFADLLESPIPDVDFVGQHGVWSWVSDENRAAIRRFFDRRLKSGGVVMTSYNTLPGWSASRALRELMMRKYRSTAGPTANRIQEALNFAVEMRNAGALIFKTYPSLNEGLDFILKMSKHYLAHEYFNQDWHLFYHHEVAEALASSRLSFLCSAKPVENYDKLNFPAPVLALLEQVAAGERETTRDLYLNRMFRFDLYGRGVEKVGLANTAVDVMNRRFTLTDDPAKLADGKVKTTLGAIKLRKELYAPVLERLSAGPALGAEFLAVPGHHALKPVDLSEVLALLVDTKVVSVALPEQGQEQRAARTRRLNEVLKARTMKSEDIGYLMSPVTGLAHEVPNYLQYFMVGEDRGQDPLSFAWTALKQRGRRMQRDGKALDSDEDNRAELGRRWEEYNSILKPRLRGLGILPA